MGQNSPIPPDTTTTTSSYPPTNNRFRFKRNPNPNPIIHISNSFSSSSDRRRSHPHGLRSVGQRKFSSVRLCYMCLFLAFFSFLLVSMLLQSSIGDLFSAGALGVGTRRTVELEFGSSVRFLPKLAPRTGGLQRTKPRVGVRSPRLAIHNNNHGFLRSFL